MQWFLRVKAFYVQYERHLSSAALITGFVIDSFTLTRADLWLDNIILISYLALIGAGIAVIQTIDLKREQRRMYVLLRELAPLGMQFAFGGLFSGLLVLYSRSTSLLASWPFLLLLAGLLIGNEFFREYYERLTFQITIYFVALFSYSALVLPVLVRRIGPEVFVFAGVVSILCVVVFLRILRVWLADLIRARRVYMFASIGTIFLCMNALYMFNLIPPIPLSLKEAGVYHRVVRMGTQYTILREVPRWYDIFDPTGEIHVREGDPLYFFGAVFAPTSLDTDIVHRWERNIDGSWTTVSRVRFAISGGREEGYRGYSLVTNVVEGKWRVNVETVRGQIIGRREVDVYIVDTYPPLETVRR